MVLGVLGPAVGTFIVQSLLTEAQRERPGRKLGNALKEIQALQARGLDPMLSRDPFTGGLVVSTADQFAVLPGILLERQRSRILAPTTEELDEIRAFRQAFIDAGRSQGLVDPRVAAAAAVEPVAAPIVSAAETSVTARLVAPGVVVRGTTPRLTSRRLKDRLSGQCAGPQTGITRLRCGRGGFA